MRHIYHFKDRIDVIENEILTKKKFGDFLIDFRDMNSEYVFDVYLGGSYLDYLREQKETYNDIDFFIMAEKIIDLNDLGDFLVGFHSLAKKHKFAYDLFYLMDASGDDINNDQKSQYILNLEGSRIIKLYHSRTTEKTPNKGNKKFKPIEGFDLYEGKITYNNVGSKFINKSQINRFFNKPIKIE